MSELTPIAFPAAQIKVYGSKILVGTPWQKQVCPITALCTAMVTDTRRCASALHWGDAFVAHSRNTLGDLFLNSNCEWMLMVDDDMVIPFGNAQYYRHLTGMNLPEPFASFHTIDRLLSHKKTLVGALYFGRQGVPGKTNGVYAECVTNPQEAAFAHKGPHNMIKPTKWVGTGCMMVHRSVLEDIEKKFPRLARGPQKKGGHWFTSCEASLLDQLEKLQTQMLTGPLDGQKAYKAVEFISNMLAQAKAENPNMEAGEDVSFCLRAAAAGHLPYVDLGLVCGHAGLAIFGL